MPGARPGTEHTLYHATQHLKLYQTLARPSVPFAPSHQTVHAGRLGKVIPTLLHPAAKRWLGHQPQACLSWRQSRARPQKNPSAFSAQTYMAGAGHPTHGSFSSSFIGRPAHRGGPGLGWGGRAFQEGGDIYISVYIYIYTHIFIADSHCCTI